MWWSNGVSLTRLEATQWVGQWYSTWQNNGLLMCYMEMEYAWIGF